MNRRVFIKNTGRLTLGSAIVPPINLLNNSKFNNDDIRLLDNLKNNLPNLVNLMNKQNLNEYIKMVVNFSFEANKYFNDSEPWAVKKKDPIRMKTIIHTIMEQIKDISILLSPIMPIASSKILDSMNIDIKFRNIECIKNTNMFNFELELKKPGILFKKIENDY